MSSEDEAPSDGSVYGGRKGTRMVLRKSTMRRLPGRYREDVVPDDRPKFFHQRPVFNPILARFVGPHTIPLDHEGESPSRKAYREYLEQNGIQNNKNREGKDSSPDVAFRPFPEVLNGTSRGPAIAHLPPLSERQKKHSHVIKQEDSKITVHSMDDSGEDCGKDNDEDSGEISSENSEEDSEEDGGYNSSYAGDLKEAHGQGDEAVSVPYSI